jgi:hypothetical protein
MIRAVFASIALCCVSAAHAEDPQWLKEARAREGKIGSLRDLKSDDNWLKARVPVKVKDLVKQEKAYVISFDVGGETPAYCEVIPEGFDMADMLRQTVDITMKEVEPIQGKVEAREIEFTDAGSFGEAPYLAARWLYRVNDGKETRLGALKQLVFEKYGHGVYCSHIDIGYVKTFDAMTRAMAESFEAPPATATPYFREISVASMAGSKIGVAVTTLEKDADGDSKARQMTAIVLRSTNGDINTQDSIHLEWVHPDGSMINALDVVAANGEVYTNVALKREDTHWLVDGEMQGKKVSARLAADAQPRSWVEQSRDLRKVLEGDKAIGAVHSMPMWVSLDPGRLTDMKTTVLEKKGPNEFSARSSAGPLESQLLLDKATGLPSVAEIPMGPQTVRLERVHVSGSF